MKTKHLLSVGLAGTLALITQTNFAQTWQMVDDFQYVAGQAAVNFGLAVAPSGALFASGFAYDASGVGHGLVMASADAGNTWSAPLDDFVYPGSTTRYDGGIVSDSAGNLYVAGRYYGGTASTDKIVRRSADGGATWTTVDDFQSNNYYEFPLAAGGITADAGGNVYVTEPFSAWVVRKGAGGTNFTTVDSLSTGGGITGVEGVFAHPTAGVFSVGSAYVVVKNRSTVAWLVRRSTNGGATWTTVDAYQASSGYGARALSAGADGKGNIYVVGEASVPYKSSSFTHWIIRKSADGGTSWTTVDNYQLSTTSDQRAVGFATDSNGNLYAAGYTWGTGSQWIVRQNSGGTGTWTTVDSFPYVSGANAHAIAADSLGNVFVGGQGSPARGAVHWLVRKN